MQHTDGLGSGERRHDLRKAEGKMATLDDPQPFWAGSGMGYCGAIGEGYRV
eukprot:CAMPEP_0174374734 /NCGR_PEP_ID=MMETSP0811_2-20130205/111992_1 /TAXON_ID=73025 ORGANISM="Eutreptiella gymnastica-like, Strain CCMP1594" /NCGR_SAMPLE_ID=MMETSP0811_2 /ASSEMBLY_ACC=CAM_ASM_000667 /LENGTH=50 /DNA_ID=CAMNT_0015524299 /DNA_START=755 /DNA_END=907 /DNA_ORIENTATION=+